VRRAHHPPIDWDRYDVGVSIMSTSCVMTLDPVICLRQPDIEARVAVSVATGCQASLHKDQFYLLPKIAPEAQVTQEFTISEAAQTP
jgi:hypothetical protein